MGKGRERRPSVWVFKFPGYQVNQTTNNKPQTPNNKQQTTNPKHPTSKQQTKNNKHPNLKSSIIPPTFAS
jgi:hypothetical protein